MKTQDCVLNDNPFHSHRTLEVSIFPTIIPRIQLRASWIESSINLLESRNIRILIACPCIIYFEVLSIPSSVPWLILFSATDSKDWGCCSNKRLLPVFPLRFETQCSNSELHLSVIDSNIVHFLYAHSICYCIAYRTDIVF